MRAAGSINMAAIGAITEKAVTRTSNIQGLNINNAGVFDVNFWLKKWISSKMS